MLANLLSRRSLYTMPGDPAKDTYVITVSGGADSVVLAILLHLMYPMINFRMLFTDTKADEKGVYTTLQNLEAYLGKQIERIIPKAGLFDLVEKYGGFIPSTNARYCTRELKLVEFQKWLGQTKQQGGEIYAFVGIRADESTRIAFSDPMIHTELPYMAMNVVREEVFAVLEETVGIPNYYRTRTRSGCSVCPFQRKSEQIGLLLRDKAAFLVGAKYEKVASLDEGRFMNHAPMLAIEIGLSLNHLSFPLPALEAEISGKVKRTKTKLGIQQDFFTTGMWVAVEFFVDPMIELFGGMGIGNGVWQQSLVSYSTTRAGLQRQLDNHYQHRLHTAEVMGLKQEQLRQEMRYAIYFLDMPSDQVDAYPLHAGGFTWQQGESYRQISHLVSWIMRTLHAAGLSQTADAYRSALQSTNDSEHWIWLEEQYASTTQAMDRLVEPVGTIASAQYYQPKEVISDDLYDERFIPCPLCHI